MFSSSLIFDIFLIWGITFIIFEIIFIINNINNNEFKNSKFGFWQDILNSISFNWAESAGIDETSEGGSETFANGLLTLGFLSAFLSFVPFFISLNSDFSFIFSFSIVIIFLSFMLFLPLTFNKVFTEILERKSPMIFIPILTIIELISYMFKVLSLTIRISVNSSTGHALALIFFTIGGYLIEFSSSIIGKLGAFIFYCICLIYMLMEVFISLLQLYVINLLAYYYEFENF